MEERCVRSQDMDMYPIGKDHKAGIKRPSGGKKVIFLPEAQAARL